MCGNTINIGPYFKIISPYALTILKFLGIDKKTILNPIFPFHILQLMGQ